MTDKLPPLKPSDHPEHRSMQWSKLEMQFIKDYARQAVREAVPKESDQDLVLIPRALIGSACHAIRKRTDAPKTLEQLRRYTVGDLSSKAVREAVPEGFVLVPVEPTEAMLQAALDCQDADPEDGSASEVYYGYKAMIAAAKETKPS